ncbi:MAG: MOSC domain-containing protein [Thermoleophilaceae bacterium]|nr:MOSC domain-containing protein [Thermoleophilaceae bacterium]
MSGFVAAIYLAPGGGEPMQARKAARAVPGRGLDGDRYFKGAGAFSGRVSPGREVTELTLIEDEVIEHLKRDLGLDVTAADSRRNLVTRLIPLNDLVGAEFRVGNVLLRGTGLCEPCVSLVKSPENTHLLRGLAHKGGLRAQILSEGVIAVGDLVGPSATAQLAAVG